MCASLSQRIFSTIQCSSEQEISRVEQSVVGYKVDLMISGRQEVTSSTIASHNHQPPERDGYTNANCKATNACQLSANSLMHAAAVHK